MGAGGPGLSALGGLPLSLDFEGDSGLLQALCSTLPLRLSQTR